MNIIIIFKILNLINCVPDGKVIWLEELCFQLEFTYLWKEKRKKKLLFDIKISLKCKKKKKKKTHEF
jgi:hypothetical protein